MNRSPPRNFIDAVFKQYSDVDREIDDAVRMMEKCRLGFSNDLVEQATEQFKTQLLQAHQHIGNKADFCDTKFASRQLIN